MGHRSKIRRNSSPAGSMSSIPAPMLPPKCPTRALVPRGPEVAPESSSDYSAEIVESNIRCSPNCGARARCRSGLSPAPAAAWAMRSDLMPGSAGTAADAEFPGTGGMSFDRGTAVRIGMPGPGTGRPCRRSRTVRQADQRGKTEPIPRQGTKPDRSLLGVIVEVLVDRLRKCLGYSVDRPEVLDPGPADGGGGTEMGKQGGLPGCTHARNVRQGGRGQGP